MTNDTKRQQLIGQLRRALGQAEDPNNDIVEIQILDITNFEIPEEVLNEPATGD